MQKLKKKRPEYDENVVNNVEFGKHSMAINVEDKKQKR